MEQPTAPHPADIDPTIQQVLARHPSIILAVPFGSIATRRARFDSDLDLAVAATTPLTAQARIDLIADLAVAIGRPVDLNQVHNPLLRQIVTQGRLIVCKNRSRYADLLLRMLYEEADSMPYYRRILSDRRRTWIGT
ncbi:MAG: nucleotidyltransferase domain-containing protein [Nitrospira sp.]|jgi:predicted nucleotidyltransferase|nr:MAG: nucleotidyltransferase domain-containing protein [Nitrospira sp.]